MVLGLGGEGSETGTDVGGEAIVGVVPPSPRAVVDDVREDDEVGAQVRPPGRPRPR